MKIINNIKENFNKHRLIWIISLSSIGLIIVIISLVLFFIKDDDAINRQLQKDLIKAESNYMTMSSYPWLLYYISEKVDSIKSGDNILNNENDKLNIIYIMSKNLGSPLTNLDCSKDDKYFIISYDNFIKKYKEYFQNQYDFDKIKKADYGFFTEKSVRKYENGNCDAIVDCTNTKCSEEEWNTSYFAAPINNKINPSVSVSKITTTSSSLIGDITINYGEYYKEGTFELKYSFNGPVGLLVKFGEKKEFK